MKYTTYSTRTTLIERKNPKTGFKEVTTFYGNIKNKPKGWKISPNQ